MKLARFSVERPVFTTMATLMMVTLGAISLLRLPIDLMPSVTYPTLSVVTSYANASPQEMEELVTRTVEGALAAVPGVSELSSVSSEGSSSVRVAFAWGTDLDVAANDMRDRLSRILDDLPADASPPELRKFDVASFPILIYGAASPIDPVESRRLIDNQVLHRIERIPGVAAVDVWGGLTREIRVNVDADKLMALGLSLDQVRQAILAANINVPAGEIERGNYEISLRTPGEFSNLDELRDTVVSVIDGAPVYLHQVARVEDGIAKVERIVRTNGEPSVRLAVRKQSGANTVAVAERVKREMEQLRIDFPQFTFTAIIDTAKYIRLAIENLGRSVLYGGGLAVLVLLFFLRSIPSTLVVSTAIPISIIATFALVYFGGLTLNLMTLGGLALGVGMMVDNSIVVTENINRLRETRAATARDDAIDGAEEVTPAIVAATITTLAIFLPLVFMEELVGQLFRQLGLVVSFALVCSLFVAVTLVPMLASRLLARRGTNPPADAAAAQATSTRVASGRMVSSFSRMLRRALNERLLVLCMLGASLLAVAALVPGIGTEFMPTADESEVRVTAEMEPGTRLELVDRQMQQVEAIVRDAVPETLASVASVGSSGGRGGSAEGSIRLSLAPVAERTRSSAAIADDLRGLLAAVPGMSVRTREGQGLFLLRIGNPEDETLKIEIRGYDLDTLDAIANGVKRAIEDVPGITDVRLSRRGGVPQQVMQVVRDRAADLGVSVERIARTLETAIAGSRTGNFRDGGEEVRILVRLEAAERLDTDDILDLTVPNERDEPVLMRSVVRAEPGRGPLQIERQNQQRVAYVSANVAGRDLGSIVAEVQARLATIPVPRNYDVLITGDWEEQQKAFSQLLLNIVLALALVYMVLACLYESLIDPLVVMCSVPLAFIGVVLALVLTDTTFNAQSFIGCIMLIGIVVNNAILIVDQASRLRLEDGLSSADAAREAATRRLRPILMTSLTTALALLPLALGWGEGAEAQAPLARVVIGGLASSALITLVVVPVVYTFAHPGSRSRTVQVVRA